jgi:hypothetical protein
LEPHPLGPFLTRLLAVTGGVGPLGVSFVLAGHEVEAELGQSLANGVRVRTPLRLIELDHPPSHAPFFDRGPSLRHVGVSGARDPGEGNDRETPFTISSTSPPQRG